MNSTEVERRLRQVTWPEPSSELRARVLAESTVRPQLIAWSDRLWFSRTWRLSMAALVIAVFTIRAWPGSPAAASSDPSPQALADAQAIEETGRDIGLPGAVIASLARRALTHSQRRALTFSAPAIQFLGQEEIRRD
jgi:hypothetical protein